MNNGQAKLDLPSNKSYVDKLDPTISALFFLNKEKCMDSSKLNLYKNTFSEVLFNQKRKIIVYQGKSVNSHLVAALVANMASVGFKFDRASLKVIKTLSKIELRTLHDDLMNKLKTLVGDHVRYQTLFLSFPNDVPEDSEYLFRRLIGFFQNFLITNEDSDGSKKLSCGCVVDESLFDVDLFGACPICQMQTDEQSKNEIDRTRLQEKVALKVISLGSESEALDLVTNLFNSKSSYSKSSIQDVDKLFKSLKNDISEFLPESIVIKENLVMIVKSIVNYTTLDVKYKNFTATDVLRLAVAFSEGDVSLTNPTKFKLNNKQRKIVMNLLEKTSNKEEDMIRHYNAWLLLGKYLHIGAYSKKYPSAYRAFETLRNRPKTIQTFSRKSHKIMLDVIRHGKIENNQLDFLKTRPGEFARKLDLILRETDNQKIIEEFSLVVNKIPNAMLLKLLKYFEERNERSNYRHFLPKGEIAKIFISEKDDRKTLTKDVQKPLIFMLKKEVLKRFSKKEKMEHVFIDPALKDILVPFTQRSATKSMNTVERGSKVKILDNTKTLRMFVYWKENEKSGRLDVDLSVVGYDKNWNFKDHLAFTRLNGSKIDGVHSGDIQSAPNGASEFIDVNLEKTKKNGVRYLAMNINSFRGPSFAHFECFAGVMERQSPKSGEIYEPKTVQNKFDVTGDSKATFPLIFDLETNEMIWCDLSLDQKSGRVAVNDQRLISRIGKVTVDLSKSQLNLFELFTLHAKACGAKIDLEKDEKVRYDQVFDMNRAKNIMDILANWI